MGLQNEAVVERMDPASESGVRLRRDPSGVADMKAWLDSLPQDWQDLREELKIRRRSRIAG